MKYSIGIRYFIGAVVAVLQAPAMASVPRITDVDSYHQFDLSKIQVDKKLAAGGEGNVALGHFIEPQKFRFPKPGTLKKLHDALKVKLGKPFQLPTVHKYDPRLGLTKKERTYSVQFIEGRLRLTPDQPSPKHTAKTFFLDHCLVDVSCFTPLSKTLFKKKQRANVKLMDETGETVRTIEFPDNASYKSWSNLFSEMKKLAKVQLDNKTDFYEVIPKKFVLKEPFTCLIGEGEIGVSDCAAQLAKEFKNAGIHGRFRDWTEGESIVDIYGIYVGKQGYEVSEYFGTTEFAIKNTDKQTISEAAKIYSIGLVLEYCPGGDLTKALQWSFEEIRTLSHRLIASFADGLRAMHKQNAIHADIKLRNVLLCGAEGRFPKLADFGMYRIKGTNGTKEGGTPEYFPPEYQKEGKVSLEEGADYWAAGLTLYKLLRADQDAYPIDELEKFARKGATNRLLRGLQDRCSKMNIKATQAHIKQRVDDLYFGEKKGDKKVACVKEKINSLLQCDVAKRMRALDTDCS